MLANSWIFLFAVTLYTITEEKCHSPVRIEKLQVYNVFNLCPNDVNNKRHDFIAPYTDTPWMPNFALKPYTSVLWLAYNLGTKSYLLLRKDMDRNGEARTGQGAMPFFPLETCGCIRCFVFGCLNFNHQCFSGNLKSFKSFYFKIFNIFMVATQLI